MNSITASLTEADLLLNYERQTSQAPYVRGMRWLRWMPPAVFIGFGAALWLWMRHEDFWLVNPNSILVPCVVAVALWVPTVPPLVRWYNRRTWLKSVRADMSHFAPFTLRIEPDGLTHESGLHTLKMKWDAFEGMETTGTHAFILFAGSQLTYILPKARVTQGDVEVFVSELSGKIACRQSKPG